MVPGVNEYMSYIYRRQQQHTNVNMRLITLECRSIASEELFTALSSQSLLERVGIAPLAENRAT